jgi:pimeloyl-ACP methyl ester carboxylesterase
LVGHSLGGYVVLAMAARDPQFSKKLVLFYSSVFADSHEKRANRDKVIDFLTKNGLAAFVETFVPSLFYNKRHPGIEGVISICAQTPLITLVGYTKAMRDRPTQEAFLTRYPNPILILAGEKDEIVPFRDFKKNGFNRPGIGIFCDSRYRLYGND